MVGSEFKIVGKRVGAGNFGEVRIGVHIPSGERVAIKIERIVHNKGISSTVRLRHEYEMLKRLHQGFPKEHKINGIPKLYYFGKCGTIDCMVLELLGANLEDLFEMCGARFSMKTTLMLAFQLLDRIETVHSRGLVYRDIKPENFLLGRKGGKFTNVIHLIDYGLATYYRDPTTNRHLPYRDLKTMTGTARYMSINSHLGKSQSRRDDLESIGYTLIYFAKGRLPWQGFKTCNIKDKYRKIRDAKMKSPPNVLCEGLPVQFTAFMSYVKKLNYSDTPDYEYIKDLFHQTYESLGYSYEDAEFDWAKTEMPSNVAKFNKVVSGKTSNVSSVDTEASETFQTSEDDLNGNHLAPENVDRKNSATTSCSHHEEKNDTVGELTDIRFQTAAMSGLSNSKWNVKSMSLSSMDALMTAGVTPSTSAIEDMEGNGIDSGWNSSASNLSVIPIMARLGATQSSSVYDITQSRFGSNVMTENAYGSQGYYSYSGNDHFIDSPPDKIRSRKGTTSESIGPQASSWNDTVNHDVVTEEIKQRKTEAIEMHEQITQTSNGNANQGYEEAVYTEERVSFLCFTWRKKKKDVTYHNGKISSSVDKDDITTIGSNCDPK